MNSEELDPDSITHDSDESMHNYLILILYLLFI